MQQAWCQAPPAPTRAALLTFLVLRIATRGFLGRVSWDKKISNQERRSWGPRHTACEPGLLWGLRGACFQGLMWKEVLGLDTDRPH